MAAILRQRRLRFDEKKQVQEKSKLVVDLMGERCQLAGLPGRDKEFRFLVVHAILSNEGRKQPPPTGFVSLIPGHKCTVVTKRVLNAATLNGIVSGRQHLRGA